MKPGACNAIFLRRKSKGGGEGGLRAKPGAIRSSAAFNGASRLPIGAATALRRWLRSPSSRARGSRHRWTMASGCSRPSNLYTTAASRARKRASARRSSATVRTRRLAQICRASTARAENPCLLSRRLRVSGSRCGCARRDELKRRTAAQIRDQAAGATSTCSCSRDGALRRPRSRQAVDKMEEYADLYINGDPPLLVLRCDHGGAAGADRQEGALSAGGHGGCAAYCAPSPVVIATSRSS